MLPTLQEAIAAIKAGDKKTGRVYLAEILQADPENEMAWLWLAGVVESDERRRQCLERVLEINPDNQAAQRGLASLPPGETAPPEPIIRSPLEPSGPLMSRLAVRQQQETEQVPGVDLTPVEKKSRPQEPPAGASTGQPDTIEATSAEMQPQPAESRPAAPPPAPTTPQPSSPLEERLSFHTGEAVAPPAAADDEAIAAESEPDRPASFWQTDQGKLVMVGGGAALLVLCVVCVAAIVVFQPLLVRIPPTVAAAVGTDTPTATFTPTPPPPTDTPTPAPTPTTTPTLTASPTGTQVVPHTPTVTLTPTRTPTPNRNLQEGLVVGVLAGDVIDVLIDGVNYRVKYIMVETPTVDDPETGTQPFGAEALELNRRLVEGKQVKLEKDEAETDESGRLLRYVYVDDLMVNEELIRQGLARVVLIPPNTKYGARLQEAERTAQEAGLGIWSLESSQ